MRWGPLAVLALTLACGRLGFDPVGDGSEAEPVSLIVFDDGAVVSGLDVLFHSPDGALTTHTTTDAAGTASAFVDPNSSVTLIWIGTGGENGQYWLDTLYGIAPGDTLTFSAPQDPGAQAGFLLAQLPGTLQGASSYAISHGCSENEDANPNGVEGAAVPLRCARDGTASVLALALAADGTPLAFSGKADIGLLPSGPTMVTMPSWSTNVLDVTFRVTGLPPTATSIETKTEIVSGGASFGGDKDSTTILQEPVVLSVIRPQGFDDEFGHFPCVFFAGGGASGKYIRQNLPNNDVTMDVDMTDLLPEVFLVALDRNEGGAILAVQTAGSMAAADVGLAQIQWSRGAQKVRWSLAFPPEVTQIATPALPDEFSQLELDGSETIELPEIIYLEPSFIESYAEFRAQWWAKLLEPMFLPEQFGVLFSEGPGGFNPERDLD